MTITSEWVGANNCEVTVVGKNFDLQQWGYTDDTSEGMDDITEGPSIVLGGDEAFVITADNYDGLVDIARTILRMVEDAKLANQYTDVADGINADNDDVARRRGF